MATPAPADDVVIKAADGGPENDGQPAQQQQEELEEDEPAILPLSTQEQLQAMARRREAAVSFRNQVGECRLALRYSVIGWTGTLAPVSRQRLFLVPPPSPHARLYLHRLPYPPTCLPARQPSPRTVPDDSGSR